MNGLNNYEVEQQRNKFGYNELKKDTSNSFIKLLINSLSDPIIKILLVALAIKILFLFKNFDWYETIGILIAVFLASLISTLSEYGSNKAFERLQKETSNFSCKVYRNNKLVNILSKEIVVNDIVKIETGDIVPADGILISGSLSVNEAFITGESSEVVKDITSKLYASSTVLDGTGVMRVTEIGVYTAIGNISKKVQEQSPISPLRKRLTILAKQISLLGYLGAFLASILYLFNSIFVNNNFELFAIKSTLLNGPLMINYLMYCLTLSVAIIIMAVPEGLPMMITLVLSSNMKKLLKENVLVRKLSGIEASGSMNVLLCDKTGTLTTGKIYLNQLYLYDGSQIKCFSDLKHYSKMSQELLKSLYYNNESSIQNGKVVGGNSTDRAIMKFFPSEFTLCDEVSSFKPFSSATQYSKVTIGQREYIKGAAEILCKKCKYYVDEFGNEKLADTDYLLKKIISNTSEGKRVLLNGYLKNDNIVFICFIILEDEIRSEAYESVKKIHSAGINVVMVTGDSLNCALNVSKKIGIINNSEDLAISHDEIDEYIKSGKINNVKVIARAVPLDKSKLVDYFQNEGKIVGMTGDGVNDSIALKKSDVGFSLGSGCEVAKEASDIILLDDNIKSICSSILFGRTIFKSIRKFVIYQLTVNICALLLSVLGVFIGIATPITIIQMLWLNMIMDTLAGLAFSFEPSKEEYLFEQPKDINEPIVNVYMKNQIICNSLFFTMVCIVFAKAPFVKNIFRYDIDNLYFLTGFFALFVFLGINNSFLARTKKFNPFDNIADNKAFLLITIIILIFQFIILYNGGKIFRTYGLNLRELVLVLLLCFTMFPFDYIRKKIFIKKHHYINI